MGAGLAVLLTNIWLDTRAGSETVTRDLAFGLLRRGHRPIVYSPTLGEAAQDIAVRGVPIIDDLTQIREAPDIIHAHHSIPCGEALIRFPHVPALYVCHAFEAWMEGPVHFPQVGAYAAVDEACRDRLVHKEGIDPTQVVMLPNAVDLSRIPSRAAGLPQRPLRAAAFGKAVIVPEIAVACAQAGLDYTPVGWPASASLANPEQELVAFDLVFASARSALEAMCCGCAVIVCDRRGVAGLVTTRNFEDWRMRNFGLRSLGDAVTAQRLVDEIGRYDPADAAAVAKQARDAADIEKYLDRVEGLYAEILSGPRRPVISPQAHELAVARFLRENLPRNPKDARWPWLGLREEMDQQIQSHENTIAELSRHWAAANQERLALRIEIDEAGNRLAQVERQRDGALAQLADAVRRLRQEEGNRRLADAQVTRADEGERDLEARLAAARRETTTAQYDRERLDRENHDLSRQLTDLNRSRLLRLGRWVRRLLGQAPGTRSGEKA